MPNELYLVRLIQHQSCRPFPGDAPWVKLLHARASLAPRAEALLQSLRQSAPPPGHPPSRQRKNSPATEPRPTSAEEATTIYRSCLQRWHILERFPRPDWSIVD